MSSYYPESPPERKERQDGDKRRKFDWSSMDSVVREADEKKVKDCKEDIDTLLVFAGLFSAVLTAFVVESYKNLQPDPSSQTVALLTQISVQLSSYAVTPGFANSTAHAITQAINFKPSPAMVKVNALWFASLVCSLVTASLGMLVKQWLREYLSGDYYSPQARLRARQFRNGGIVSWKVYDIAALLPLLLQVALGLFFLGLCIFTQSVNSTVGWTSIPLVLAWLLVLVLTTVAPAFSARCPYKVTFLISALRIIRIWGWRALPKIYRRYRSFIHEGSLTSMPPSTALSEAIGSQSTLPRFTQSYSFLRSRKAQEEEEALVSERNDINLILAVDCMLSDDFLVGTTFRDYIGQLRSSGEEVVAFVLQIMERRLQRGERLRPAALPLADLRPLTKRAWVGLTGILADALHNEIFQEIHQQDDDQVPLRQLHPWMHNMLRIILSNSGYTIQQSEAEILVYSLIYDPSTTVTLMRATRRSITMDDCTDILRMCRCTLNQFSPSNVMTCILHIVRWCTVNQNLREYETLEQAVTSKLYTREGILDVVEVVLELLHSEVLGQFSGRLDCLWHAWMDDALCTVIYAYTLLREDNVNDKRLAIEIYRVVGLLCAESDASMRRFLRCITESINRERNSFLRYQLLARAMSHSTISDRDYYQILDNFIAVAKDVVNNQDVELEPVRLYHLASHVSTLRRPSIPDERDRLRALFTHILSGLQALQYLNQEASELAESCTVILDSFDAEDMNLPENMSSIFAEDLDKTFGSDDFVPRLNARTNTNDTKVELVEEKESKLPDDMEHGIRPFPRAEVLAPLQVVAPDFEEMEFTQSTPQSLGKRRKRRGPPPRIPPLIFNPE